MKTASSMKTRDESLIDIYGMALFHIQGIIIDSSLSDAAKLAAIQARLNEAVQRNIRIAENAA